MSYDYNAILGDIQQLRSKLTQNHHGSESSDFKIDLLQRIVEKYSDFSSKCPMTPLLWAQYAYDAGELMELLLEEDGCDSKLDAKRLKSNWETQLGILQLGVGEFPGCIILRRLLLEIHCRIFYMCIQEKSNSEMDRYAYEIQIKEAYHDAWFHVGRGSHRTDDVHVLAIHQIYVSFLVHSITTKADDRKEVILESFLERAQSPMKGCNDSIMDDLKLFGQRHNIPFTEDDFSKIESVRKLERKYFGILISLEEDVQIAMANEGIAPSTTLLQYLSDTDQHGFIEWGNLLRNPTHSVAGNFLMGGGMLLSSHAFQKYAESLRNYERIQNSKTIKSASKHRKNLEDDEDECISKEVTGIISSLIMPVYERAVSECPTVEGLWIDYIKYLSFKVEKEAISTNTSLVEDSRRLSDVATRSIRNCPYSIRLYGYRFKALAGTNDFNPDNCLSIINEGLQLNFISVPQGALNLYLSLIAAFKERILSLISRTSSPKHFDESESLETLVKKAKKLNKDSETSLVVNLNHQLLPLFGKYGESLDDDTADEIRDLIDDIREIFDSASKYLNANFPLWTLGKSELQFERAHYEAYVIAPIILSSSLQEEDDLKDLENPILLYEQLVRAHQPPRPKYWRSYINYLSTETFYKVSKCKLDCDIGPGVTVGARIRFMRGIFHRALSSTKHISTLNEPEDEEDLRALCGDLIQFEKSFGSDKSRDDAMGLVSSKKSDRNSDNENATMIQSTEFNTRDRKRLKPSQNDANDCPNQTTNVKEETNQTGDLKQDAHGKDGKVVHKIRIGSLYYPAHPYTIRVTNLSPDTEDMDLVDVLRGYGQIVHARILREKQSHGPGISRGVALVQFEEKASVENVLSSWPSVKDQQLIIERSHQPAVSLVPPGMHRKNPPRDGKNSKDNRKKEDSCTSGSVEDAHVQVQDDAQTKTTNTRTFIPRSALPNRKMTVALR